MTITFPTTKTIKDSIRSAIGQEVTFVIQGDPVACPVCSGLDLYDGVNETSLDPFCGICEGAYFLTTDISSGIVSHVRWRNADQPDMGQTGETFVGDCYITIDIDALTEAQLTKVKEVRVDDRRLQIYRTMKRGAPSRDRVRFTCREWGKE